MGGEINGVFGEEDANGNALHSEMILNDHSNVSIIATERGRLHPFVRPVIIIEKRDSVKTFVFGDLPKATRINKFVASTLIPLYVSYDAQLVSNLYKFSPVAYFGDSRNYTPLTAARWQVSNTDSSTLYHLNTSNYTNQSGNRLGEYAIAKDSIYQDFKMVLKAKSPEAASNTSASYAMVFAYVDADNYTYMQFSRLKDETRLYKVASGIRTAIGATASEAGITETGFQNITLTRTGSNIQVRKNNIRILSITHTGLNMSGMIGVGAANDEAYFDDINLLKLKIPFVKIIKPVAGTVFTQCDTIALEAQTTNFENGVKQVSFYRDSTLIGTDTIANDGWKATLKNLKPASFQLTAKALNSDGDIISSAAVNIEVKADLSDPVIQVTATPKVLWPPNHSYHLITVQQMVEKVTDDCTGMLPITEIFVSKVTSDETYDPKKGMPEELPILISSDQRSVKLKAERKGDQNGRVYTIHLTGKDRFGNESTSQYQVLVPHNEKDNSLLNKDDGVKYTNASAVSTSFDFDSKLASIIDDASIIVFPNPANKELNIQLSAPEQGKISIRLVNAIGRVDYQTKFNVEVGYNQLHIDLSSLSLSSGLYFVEILLNDKNLAHKKIMIIK